jgi:carboxymethylenebutenolidase
MNYELLASDRHSFAAYLAEPAGTPRGAIVVVQEIFGVNSHIKRVTDSYAEDGYLAIAPAMFDRVERGVDLGYTPDAIKVGRELKTKITTEMMTKDIEAAVAAVTHAGNVGIVGFCWGGFVTWMASAHVTGLAAAVPYYGGGILENVDIEPRVPVMLHFGERDAGIPVDSARELATRHPQAQVHIYDADHGFNCDQRDSYEAAAAKLARERTLGFFRQHVG